MDIEQADAGRDGRTRLAGPNSQARTGKRRKKKITAQLTMSRIGNLTRSRHTLNISDDHTCMHACMNKQLCCLAHVCAISLGFNHYLICSMCEISLDSPGRGFVKLQTSNGNRTDHFTATGYLTNFVIPHAMPCPVAPLSLISRSRGLERRLITRLPRERGPGVPEGRSKPKPSEEEFWHAAGVYDSTSGRQNTQNTSSTNNNVAPGEAACGESQPLLARK